MRLGRLPEEDEQEELARVLAEESQPQLETVEPHNWQPPKEEASAKWPPPNPSSAPQT